MKKQLSVLAISDSVLALGAKLDPLGLKLDPNITPEQYEGLCLFLGSAHESLKFAIGDAIADGEKLFGEEAYGYIEALGLSEEQRWQYIRVAENIPRARRVAGLTWSHHRVVAGLKDPADQSMWLKRAVKEKWSKRELEEHVREAKKSERGEHDVKGHKRRSPLVVEQVMEAAEHVYDAASVQEDGAYLVPEEPMQELARALGDAL